MAKTALVIGGTGFVGTAIVEELAKAGWQVRALSRGQMPSRLGPDIPLIKADRSQPGQLAEVLAGKKFDVVVDCGVMKQPAAAAAVDALAGRVGHYIWISTTSVYSPHQPSYPIKEDATKFPELPYAAGKLQAEDFFQQAHRKDGFPVTTLRPPYIDGAGKNIGPDPVHGRDKKLFDLVRSGELTLLAEGTLLLQPVWNRQIGCGIAQIAGNQRTFGQILNLSGATCVTIRQYYQIIAETLGVEFRFRSKSIGEFAAEHDGQLRDSASHRIFDLSKLKELTGFEPTLPLGQAIEETIAWQLQQT